MMTEPTALPPTVLRAREAHRIAADFYMEQPDWVTFFREILGVDGVVRRLFPSVEDRDAFERTAEHARIRQMLMSLREAESGRGTRKEPIKMVTVRLPMSLHSALQDEAIRRRVSVNKLCITKLLMAVESAETDAGETS